MKEQGPGKHNYTEKDLGIDPAEVWIVNTLLVIARHKIVVPLGFAAILLSALAIRSTVSNMDNPQMPTVTITQMVGDPTPKSPVELAQDRLNQLQSPDGRSLKEVMQSLGHQVGDLEDVGKKRGIVGSEGLLRRNYTSAGDSRVVFELGKWLGFGHIYAGEEVEWDSELDVLTGSTVDRFARRILNSRDQAQQSDEYIRLGQRVLGGQWNPFVIEK